MFDVYFLLVLLRTTGLVFSAPFLGDRQIPMQVKLIFSLMLSFAVYSSLPRLNININSVPYLIFLSAGEVLFGLALGMLASLPFFAVQLAGQISGYQMGLAVANVFDPGSMNRQSVVSSFLFWTTIMVFFLGNFHLLFFVALRNSFVSSPLAVNFIITPNQVVDLQRLVSGLFLISAQIGAPIMLTLLLVMISLGLITRLIPQMNIFIVGIPIQIMVGMLVLIGMTPLLAKVSRELLLNHSLLLLRLVGG